MPGPPVNDGAAFYGFEWHEHAVGVTRFHEVGARYEPVAMVNASTTGATPVIANDEEFDRLTDLLFFALTDGHTPVRCIDFLTSARDRLSAALARAESEMSRTQQDLVELRDDLSDH